jgi:hypothetical protein
MNGRQPACCNDQTAIRRAREGRDRGLDLGGVAQIDRAYLHLERRRHGLDYAELAGSGGRRGIPKDRNPRHIGPDLLEQFQPFPTDGVFERGETGSISAWPRQAVDEAGADRIGDDRRVEALYVIADPLITTSRIRINTLALRARIPTMHSLREFVEVGGLMSYGPNMLDLFRRAGELVDKLLRGAKPADIPVEQPTKFDLVVNPTTAKALGLEIPPTLLARADEVIE